MEPAQASLKLQLTPDYHHWTRAKLTLDTFTAACQYNLQAARRKYPILISKIATREESSKALSGVFLFCLFFFLNKVELWQFTKQRHLWTTRQLWVLLKYNQALWNITNKREGEGWVAAAWYRYNHNSLTAWMNKWEDRWVLVLKLLAITKLKQYYSLFVFLHFARLKTVYATVVFASLPGLQSHESLCMCWCSQTKTRPAMLLFLNLPPLCCSYI